MAFTTANKILLAKITGINFVELDTHLTLFVPVITSDIETAVGELITEYESLAPAGVAEFYPTESNRGARIRDARTVAEQRILKSIYSLLNLPGLSLSQTVIERG